MFGRKHAFRYYVGLTEGDGGAQHDAKIAERKIGIFLDRSRIAPGCTVHGNRGWFFGEAEDSLTVYVSGISTNDHRRLLAWLRRTFNQRYVGFERANPIEMYGSGVVPSRGVDDDVEVLP